MMKKILAVIVLALASAGVQAQEAAQLMVSDAYVRGLPPTAANTAAYMTLMNHGNEVLELTGASSPVADMVMLHESFEDEGMMSMRHVDSASVPVGGELHLATGGLHLMLIGLKRPLAAGDEVELTLQFAGGLQKSLVVPVRSVRAESSDHRNH